MTALADAATLLVEHDGFSPTEAALWLREPGHVDTVLHVWRTRRASWLQRSGLVETPRTMRASRMISALLAVRCAA